MLHVNGTILTFTRVYMYGIIKVRELYNNKVQYEYEYPIGYLHIFNMNKVAIV